MLTAHLLGYRLMLSDFCL